MNKAKMGIFALAAWMIAATVFGQGTIIPIKTPPLRDSDTYTFPVTRHFAPTRPEPPVELPGAGWAGARVTIHVADPSEVDVDALVAAPGYLIRYPGSPNPVFPGLAPGLYPVVPAPFGPRSNNVGSVPMIVTVIHPLANQSGINPPTSHFENMMNVVLHAKNTNVAGNSDIDVTFGFSDIWHTRSNPGSQVVHFPNSVRFWSNSSVNDDPSSWQQFHITPAQDPQWASHFRIPEGPPIDVPGHWAHIPFSLPFHTYPSPGSNFFAYAAATVLGLGIEHFVPEPVSVALLGMGVACASIGVFSRRRRRLQQ